MPDPAAEPAPNLRENDREEQDGQPSEHRTAGRLAWLAGAACAACCALPALVAAGLLGGGALAVVAWLPTLAVVLAGAAVATFGWTVWRRRTRAAEDAHGCAASACDCQAADAAGSVAGVSVRSRP